MLSTYYPIYILSSLSYRLNDIFCLWVNNYKYIRASIHRFSRLIRSVMGGRRHVFLIESTTHFCLPFTIPFAHDLTHKDRWYTGIYQRRPVIHIMWCCSMLTYLPLLQKVMSSFFSANKKRKSGSLLQMVKYAPSAHGQGGTRGEALFRGHTPILIPYQECKKAPPADLNKVALAG